MEAETAEGWYAGEIATLGDRIAAAREARGLKVDELARKLGVKPSTVKSWEADTSEPRSNRLQMLAGMLGVGLGWLMAGQGEGVTPPEATSDARPSPQSHRAELLAELRGLRADMEGVTGRVERLEQLLLAEDAA